jgi:flavin reductase
MASLGAAVNVVTSAGPGGRGGFTASAVCSVTDDPPTLLVCLNRIGSGNALLKANALLCVNTLAASQRELSEVFAGVGGLRGEQRFSLGKWTTLATGAPVLEEACVSFDCRIVDVVEKGTHSVFFAEIEAIRQNEKPGRALIYYGRAYHQVGEETVA